mmetsp:Transcript_83521/g.221597  ORF Transcript_83521/g.221597 Transcript_83521/m.221597 type:complete len:272 (-) Transcript_83521:1004-1819(-)
MGICEALDERGVEHRVGLHAPLPPAEEIHGSVDALIADKRVEHTTEHNVIGLHSAVVLHLLPELPALVDALESAASFDKGAVGVHRWPQAATTVGSQDVLQASAFAVADARLQDRVEQDLIGADVNACAIQQRKRLGHVAGILDLLQGLHHDRDGVLVHRHAIALHQLDGLPGLAEVPVAVRHGGVDEAVVGHVVGPVPGPLHLGEQLPGRFDVSTRAVALHQRVVRDDVQGTDLPHLLDEGAGALHVARGDTHVQDAIVGRDVQSHTRVA